MLLFFILSMAFILFTNNPLFTIFGLILTFINAGFIFLSFKINFLPLIYVIVYVGAVCVLFLFLVMIINFKQIKKLIEN